MIRLSFKNDKNDGFSIEAFIEQDFVWLKILGPRISKDEPVVNVADMFDKQIMIGQHLFEIDGPNLFTWRTTRHKAGESGLPMGLPRR